MLPRFTIDIPTAVLTRSFGDGAVPANLMAQLYAGDIMDLEIVFTAGATGSTPTKVTGSVLPAGTEMRVGLRRYTSDGALLAVSGAYTLVADVATTRLNLNTTEILALVDSIPVSSDRYITVFFEVEISSSDGTGVVTRYTFAQQPFKLLCEVNMASDGTPVGVVTAGSVPDGFHVQTWAAGDATVIADANAHRHLEIVTVSLAAGAALLTVDDETSATRAAANKLELMFRLPATAGVIITIKNTTGDTLYSIETDASGDDALFELYHDGTKWNPLRSTYPVNFGM